MRVRVDERLGAGERSGLGHAALSSIPIERAARRVLDRRNRFVIVRERGKVVRAALEEHARAQRLAHEARLTRCLVPAQHPHRVQSVDANAARAARHDRALDGGAHLAANPGEHAADVRLVVRVENGECRGECRSFARQRRGDPGLARCIHHRCSADDGRERISIRQRLAECR